MTLSMEQGPSCEDERYSPPSVRPQGSLQCSQKHITGSYSKPAEFPSPQPEVPLDVK